MAEKESELEIAVRSLFRIQSFDTNTLPQIERLGADLNFQDVVRPAERIVNFFRQIPSDRLGSLPEPKLADIQGQADLAFNLFGDILKFDPKQTDSYNVRTQLINQVERQYESLFGALSGVVSFLSSLQKDFAALERDARAAVQAAKDRANEAVEELTKQQARAQEILDEVRRVAAEQGVSQQATYFQQEGERHEKAAKAWQKYTVCIAIGLGSFAALTATMHKWGWLRPDGAYETAQFVVSKVLLFGVVVYMLVLSARTLLAHRHNAVINRHRYNALLTFNALADAAKGPENRDIVLAHAAACIYAPQDTGYTKNQSHPETIGNVVQTLPRLMASSGHQP